MRKSLIQKQISFRQGGYTLVEIVLAILVLGFFIAAAIPLYDHYMDKTRQVETLVEKNRIDNALKSFLSVRGRYPCPARYDASPDEADYGVSTICENSPILPGNCSGGLCFEQGQRTFTIGGNSVTPKVVRGAVPFRTLGLEEDDSLDEYGGRFSYAVTDILTNKELFLNSRGAIEIRDDNEGAPNSLVNPPGSAHYFVFSHGPDSIGAYSREGDLIADCNGPMSDNENCNTSIAHPSAVYRHTPRSDQAIVDANSVLLMNPTQLADSNNHYDDYAQFIGIGMQPLWEYRENNNTVTDSINLHTSVEDGTVIIGNDQEIPSTVDPDVKVLVEGIVRTSPAPAPTPAAAETESRQICGRVGVSPDCMETALLAAPETDPRSLKCDEIGKTPQAIERSRIRCIDITDPALNCPTGQAMTGIDENGVAVCAPTNRNRPCNADNFTLCAANDISVPASPHGTVLTRTTGISRTRTLTCNNGSWEFNANNDTGVCSCRPTNEIQRPSCGRGMTGNQVIRFIRTCPDGNESRNVLVNTCACNASPILSDEACPAPAVGRIYYRQDVTCVNNRPQFGPRVETSRTCVCTPRPETETRNCPAGFVAGGTYTLSRTLNCDGSRTAWQVTRNGCVCSGPTSREVACPSEFNAGNGVERCTWTCNVPNRTATRQCNTDNSACRCVESEYTDEKPCGPGFTGNETTTVRIECPGNREVRGTPNRSQCRPIVSICRYQVNPGSPMYQELRSRPNSIPSEGSTCEYSGNNISTCNRNSCYRTNGPVYEVYGCSCK